MPRNRQEAAEAAAAQANSQAVDASEAGRILQAQRHTEKEEAPRDKPEGERPPPRNEPRRRGMEEIEARDLRSKGLSETPPEPKPEIPANPAPPTAEQMLEGGKFSQPDATPPADFAPAPSQEDAVPAAAAPVETVRVKVDGEEFDVPKAEVEEAGGAGPYRMMRAMENRLKKANEANDKAQQTQAALMQWIQQQQPQQPKPTFDQLIASKIDVIRYGSPEESTAAFKEVLDAVTASNRVDPNSIEQRALLKFEIKMAANQFRAEFADVLANPKLAKLAAIEEHERLSGLRQIPDDWNHFYRQIGNELRTLMPRQSQPSHDPAPTTTTSTPSPVVDKEARKASIVTLPTASVRAEQPKEPNPETRDDILNDMRKKRGQSTG